MAEPAPLHRSAEVEDLTHITEEHTDKGTSSLHRSKEMEDLAHLSPQDINKPLINDNKQH